MVQKGVGLRFQSKVPEPEAPSGNLDRIQPARPPRPTLTSPLHPATSRNARMSGQGGNYTAGGGGPSGVNHERFVVQIYLCAGAFPPPPFPSRGQSLAATRDGLQREVIVGDGQGRSGWTGQAGCQGAAFEGWSTPLVPKADLCVQSSACVDCAAENSIKIGEPIRCRECEFPLRAELLCVLSGEEC